MAFFVQIPGGDEFKVWFRHSKNMGVCYIKNMSATTPTHVGLICSRPDSHESYRLRSLAECLPSVVTRDGLGWRKLTRQERKHVWFAYHNRKRKAALWLVQKATGMTYTLFRERWAQYELDC